MVASPRVGVRVPWGACEGETSLVALLVCLMPICLRYRISWVAVRVVGRRGRRTAPLRSLA